MFEFCSWQPVVFLWRGWMWWARPPDSEVPGADLCPQSPASVTTDAQVRAEKLQREEFSDNFTSQWFMDEMTPTKVTQEWLHCCQLLDKTLLRSETMLHCIIYCWDKNCIPGGKCLFFFRHQNWELNSLNYQSGCWPPPSLSQPQYPPGDNFCKLELLNRHQLGVKRK